MSCAVGLALGGHPLTASASCASLPGVAPGSFENAAVVFVGSVISTSDSDRRASVKVESVWRGPDLPTYVQVAGSPVSGANTATSVDRHFQSAQRYLFVPTNSSPPFDDNSCTATQVYTAALAQQTPADARPPLPGGDPGQPASAGYLPWLAGAVASILVIGAALWLRIKRRNRESLTR